LAFTVIFWVILAVLLLPRRDRVIAGGNPLIVNVPSLLVTAKKDD